MATETITFRPSKENSEMLNQLSELAKQDNRRLNNYIETILLVWLKNNPINKQNVKSKQ
jgi:hypothetical protein